MARLAKYVQAPAERKRYTIDYSEWLDAGETITNVTFEVTGMTIDDVAIMPGDTGVQYYASEGDDGETYKVVVKANTSNEQVKEDLVLFIIKDPAA